MKTLLPNQKSPMKTLSDKPFNITEEMWNHLIQDISSLQVQVENDELSLEDYKNAIAEAFATVALTANTANLNEATITNLITTILQSTDFSSERISANDISVITAMVRDSLKAGSIEAGSIKANTGANVETLTVNDNARVDGNLEVGGTINVDHVTINDFTVDNLAVSQAEINNENVANSHISEADIDSATIDNAEIVDVEITRAVIADIDNNHLDTEFITHKTNYLTQIDADNFYIKLPYFQNGAYYIYITKADGTFVGCIEDFNSSNNHFFRWSFAEPNTLNNIYLNGYNTEKSQSAYYINTRGERYNIYYQCTSYDTVEPPATSDALGFTPDKRFNVTEINGNWFTMPVALYNEGEGGGVLTLTASDVLLYADDNKSYNGTSNVHNTVYKPNQSLNKTDDVTFNSVEAPFLDVAELSIVNKAKLPNVYNGPALSAAEQADLKDDTLYIPQSGNTTGVTVPGVEFVDRETDEPLNYWASSVQKAIDQNTFRTDEYKPTDGYILSDDVTVSDTWKPYPQPLQLLQNVVTGEYFFVEDWYEGEPSSETETHDEDGFKIWKANKATITDGIITPDDTPYSSAGHSWWTSSACTTRYNMRTAQPGDILWVETPGSYVPTGEYRVRYVDTVLKATAGINYLKEGAGTAARINRKTTRSNAPAIDEIVPINNALFDSTTQEQQVGQVVTDEYTEDKGFAVFLDGSCVEGVIPADYDRTETTDTGTLVTIDGETPLQYYYYDSPTWEYAVINPYGYINITGTVEDPAILAILNGGSTTDYSYERVKYYEDVTTQTGTVPADYDRTETSTVTESGHTITTVTYYKTVVNGGYQPGNPLAYDPVTRTLIPANNAPAIVLGDNYRFEVVEQPAGSLHTHLLMRRETVAPDTYKYNELATLNSEETFDGTTPLVYDSADNSLKPAEDVTINGKAHISGNVNIDGDLTVDGKITAVSEEVVQSKADYITLRENNPNGLADGEHSGIIINNIDGEGKNTALVVDNDGMLRVGSAVGTETTYNDIFYGKNDNKWYSDSTLETEVTVEGILSRWASTTETDDYIEYTDAVFTVIDASHNEPLMTRSEAEDLTDGAPLYWNEERKRAENTAATSGQQVWMSKMTPGHSIYDKNVVIGKISTSSFAVNIDGFYEKTDFTEISQDYKSASLFNAITKIKIDNDTVDVNDNIYVDDDKNVFYKDENDDYHKAINAYEQNILDPESTYYVVSVETAASVPNNPTLVSVFEYGRLNYESISSFNDPETMDEIQYPSDIPNDAVITDDTPRGGYLYYPDDNAYFRNYQKVVAFDIEGDTTDPSITPTGTTYYVATLIYRNIHADATEDKMSYGWQQSSQGSLFVFDTFAEYQAALTIPSGQPGHIPTPEEGNAIIVVKEGKSYLYGEVNNE